MTAVQNIIESFTSGGPLVSCWNVNEGWNLNQQVRWIEDGVPYLPTIFCPTIAQRANKPNTWENWYPLYADALKFINDNRLPVTLRFHNLGADHYNVDPRKPFEESALVFHEEADGTLNDGKLLCPLAPTRPWYLEGEAIAKSHWITKLAEVLPDVPRLLFLENNEAPLAEVGFYTEVLNAKDQWGYRLRAWKPSLHTLSVRMAEWAKTHDANDCEADIKTGFVQQRWAMCEAIKANVPAVWQQKVYIGGYGGLGPLATAGLDAKRTFSYKRPQENWDTYPFAPEVFEFDVNSGRCYDAGSGGGFNMMHTVRGPQCLEHNLAPLHRYLEETRPLWHLDRSLWVQPKRCITEYEETGKYILPDRVKGFARFCLWATKAKKRATVLRWFADANETLEEPWFKGDNYVADMQHITRGDMFQPSMDCVKEVWDDKRLLKFYRDGEAVLNIDPPLCNWELPAGTVDDRSRLLYTDADPDRFQQNATGKWIDTWREASGKIPLNVFAQAWRIGESYLVYAWSPRETRQNVTVYVTGLGDVLIPSVGPEGAFQFAGKLLRETTPVEQKLIDAFAAIHEAGGDSLDEAKRLVSKALSLVMAWEDAKQ